MSVSALDISLDPPKQAGPDDFAACRAAIRAGSKSFHAASLLLPRDLRDSASAIYAFCRLSDDAVDLGGGDLAAVGRLRRRLAWIYAGAPRADSADRALADVVAARRIPREALEALLEGLAWDAEGRRYATLAELMAYAARVAGSVGAVMTALMDARSASMAARACDLGAAMQLTNIARDVGEDARAGRLYIPTDWLAEEQVDPAAFLAKPEATPAVRRLTRRLLDEADRLYRSAEPGVARLPARARPAIWAARLIYAEIGAEIARNGFDSVAHRAVTTRARKIALASRAVGLSSLGARAARAGADEPAPEGAQFLVDAVAATERAPAPAAWPLDDTVERFIGILEKLNRLDAQGRVRR